METYFPLSGDLRGMQFPSVLMNIHKKSLSGTCEVISGEINKKITIENGKITFVASNQEGDSLREFLLRNKTIEGQAVKTAAGYMKKKKVRFGRALIELGLIGYDVLWDAIRGQLKHMVFSLFSLDSGHYQVRSDQAEYRENITLNCGIPEIIIEGMRAFQDEELLYRELENVKDVFLSKPETVKRLPLKSFEIHILDLVDKTASVKEIIQRSELLYFDTLKVLYMMLILEVVATEKVERKIRRGMARRDPFSTQVSEDSGIVSISTFSSFDEALSYFNSKYELIYKVLSKEIGPIALSILSKAVEDISDNLPFFLKKFSLGPDGSVHKSPILKSVWYHDFDQNIGEFVRGLEEILYAEIYAVKRHLGVEYEQQILKWIH